MEIWQAGGDLTDKEGKGRQRESLYFFSLYIKDE